MVVEHLRPGDELELEIEDIVFGGEGIARVRTADKAFVVFLEDVVIGDRVVAKITKKKRNFARGFVKEFLHYSPQRSEPRCKHFGIGFLPATGLNAGNNGQRVQEKVRDFSKNCGGCAWQFLSYEDQLKVKEKVVCDSFERIGGFTENKNLVLPIIGSDPWYYRNKMEFSFGTGKDGELSLGLHFKHRHYDVVELTECFLLEPYIGELVTLVRKFFQQKQAGGTLDPDLQLLSFTVRQAKNTGERMLMITAENGEENFMEDFKELVFDFFKAKNLTVDSVFFIHVINQQGQRKQTQEILIAGKSTITEKLHLPSLQAELSFEISPLAFFQPNTLQAEILYTEAMKAAGLSGKEIVFDLFCGTGTIGLFASFSAGKVYGIELNESAVLNARQNAERNRRTNIEFIAGDVQKLLGKLPKNPDVILVDPPRNGLNPSIIEQIHTFSPKKIVYISCNPTSLARDAALITKTGYSLVSVQPVDMFPQTYHVENVAIFCQNLP